MNDRLASDDKCAAEHLSGTDWLYVVTNGYTNPGLQYPMSNRTRFP